MGLLGFSDEISSNHKSLQVRAAKKEAGKIKT
jgi:hypothetical protein